MPVKRTRLAARRKAVGFSQDQLAELLKVDRSTIVRWESGETAPQPWVRLRIAKTLKVSVDQLDELLTEQSPAAAETDVTANENSEPPNSPLNSEEFLTEAAGNFAGQLAKLMDERGVGVRELARRTYYNPGHISNVRTGKANPSLEMARRVDSALEADGKLSATAERIAKETVSGARQTFRVQPSLLCDDEITSDDEERIVLAARNPRRYDPGIVDSLAKVLSGQRRAEDAIGSAPLVEPVKAQLSVVRELVTEARGELRTKILDIGSQWAQFSGWLHASTSQLDEANRFYGMALEWAFEADKPNMVATALNMQGTTAWMGAKAGPMIGLSRAAQRDKRTSPGVRALAVQQEARGIALSGEATISDIDRRFDQAGNLAAQAAEKPENEPPWIYFFSPDYLFLQRGLAYRLFGEYVKASELLEVGLSSLPAAVRQSDWAAYYLLDLAKSHVGSGDVSAACSIACEINLIARQTNSRRLRQSLADFYVRLKQKWPNDPRLTELAESLC